MDRTHKWKSWIQNYYFYITHFFFFKTEILFFYYYVKDFCYFLSFLSFLLDVDRVETNFFFDIVFYGLVWAIIGFIIDSSSDYLDSLTIDFLDSLGGKVDAEIFYWFKSWWKF